MVTEENSCDMRFSRNHGNSSGKSIPFDVKEREGAGTELSAGWWIASPAVWGGPHQLSLAGSEEKQISQMLGDPAFPISGKRSKLVGTGARFQC